MKPFNFSTLTYGHIIALALGTALLLAGAVFALGGYTQPPSSGDDLVSQRTEEEVGDEGAAGADTMDAPFEKPERALAPILVYHNIRPRAEAPANVDEAYDVTPEEFEAHLRHLREHGYTSMTHREFTEALDGLRALPEKPVLIDIDDGRATQARYAEPLLERYGFTATFFVFTNAIDREGYLSWSDLARLRDAGHEIGSHTVFHPYLTRLATDAELERELADSKRVLDERLHQETVSLAYPFGLSNPAVREATERAGYTSARGLRHTATHLDAERYDRGSYITTGPVAQFLSILRAGE